MKRNNLLKLAIPLVVVLAALVFYEYVYVRVSDDLADLRKRQAVKTQILSQSIALIARKPELEQQLAVLKEQVKAKSGNVLAGESIAIASANLQGTVKGLVTARGGTISSERVGNPEDLEKAPAGPKDANAQGTAAATAQQKKAPVTGKAVKQPDVNKLKILTVSMDGALPDTGALSDVLYSIETRTPYLVTKELDIRIKNFREPREILLRMDVSGLYGGK